jgi:hypothetical protein
MTETLAAVGQLARYNLATMAQPAHREGHAYLSCVFCRLREKLRSTT